MKIKGNEKYEFYSIQLQCHSTSHSTQTNPSHVLENATQPNPTHGWTQPMSIFAQSCLSVKASGMCESINMLLLYFCLHDAFIVCI